MIYTENVTPTGLAAKLAEYIADPSTIRAHVKSHFGRAPSIDQCRNLRRAVEKRRKPMGYTESAFIIHCARHEGPYELDVDGYDRCTVCKEEKRKAEQEKSDLAARMAKQLAALKARAERDRRKRESLAEEARVHELAVAEQVLANAGKPILYQDLLVAVSAAFEMTPDEVLGKNRQRPYVDARTALAAILRKRGVSMPMIAKRLNQKDHSSVWNLLDSYQQRAKRNPLIALVVERLA